MENRKTQDWINLLLAICLFVSPWVIGFAAETVPAWNAWVVAVIIGGLAIATLSAFAEWEEWANLVLGLWLIISPWVLAFTGNAGASWTHLILGVIAVVMSAWAVWDYRHNPQVHA